MKQLDLLDFFHRLKRTKKGCWQWTGPRAKRKTCPYGWYSQMRVHRFAYEYFVGAIPDGLHVLHECDNSLCANPDHLRLGTHEENMADMHARGRHWAVRGEAVARSVLTPARVRAIRRAIKRGDTLASIAKRHRVNPTAIHCVKTGKTWRHVR